uniref:Uncharacterized protein n=1 Tax=Tetradesmus obliquus TaxID=3088 RepID=A0A383VGS1_TETOB|eukprot:jgi/Sobl393_1/2363/SZX64745.1
MIQRRYGKSTPETDAAYCQSLLRHIPLEALFGYAAAADINPLLQLHPLEAVSLTAEQQQQQQGVQLQAGWQAQVLQRLAGGCPGVPAHPVLAPLLQRAGRLLALLLPADSAAAAASAVKYDGGCSVDGSIDVQAGPAAAVAWCWPDWQQGLLELLLLKQRTARYSNAAPAAAEGAGSAAAAAVASKTVTWEPAERMSLQSLVVQRLREALAEQLQGLRQARAAEAKHQLVAAAAQQLLRHSGGAEAASEALQQLGHLELGPQLAQGSSRSARGPAAAPAAVAVKGPAATLLGQTLQLMRSDVPAVLESLGACSAQPAAPPEAGGSKVPLQPASVVPGAVTLGVLQALVAGSWCSQGPQALRRSELVLQLITHFGADSGGLLAAIR